MKNTEITSPYSLFAYFYDSLMSHVPYKKWAYNIYQIFSSYNISTKDKILEIATGTGSILNILEMNYKNIIATDISKQMLEISKKKTLQFIFKPI